MLNKVILIVILAALALAATWWCVTSPNPLTSAVRNRDLVAVQSALAAGARVDERTSVRFNDAFQNWTPLMWAAFEPDPAMVQILLAAGADRNAADQYGRTALHLVLRADTRATSLECLRLLLQAGADPNSATTRGSTPLHQAVAIEASDAAVELIRGGANPNAIDADGQTPLCLAISLRRGAEIVRTLLENGASVNVLCTGDKSPLELAQSAIPPLDKRVIDVLHSQGSR